MSNSTTIEMDPSLTAFVEPDYTLVKEDIPRAQAALYRHATIIRDLNQQLHDARQLIEQLEARKTAHVDLLAKHKVLLRGVQPLPGEVLLNIFLKCTEDDDPSCSTRAAEVLSHVCQYWRRLCLEKPDLWTRIIVVIPPYPSAEQLVVAPKRRSSWAASIWTARAEAKPIPDPQPWVSSIRLCTARTKEWIARARGLPLDMVVEGTNPLPGSPPEVESALSLLIDRTLRDSSLKWKSVQLNITGISSSQSISNLDRLLISQSTGVRDVSLRLSPYTDEVPYSIPPNMHLLTSSTIRSLSLDIAGVFDFYTDLINWSSLTHLTILNRPPDASYLRGTLNTDVLFHILSHAPNLVVCDIGRREVHDTSSYLNPATVSFLNTVLGVLVRHQEYLKRDPTAPPSFTLPRLRTLTLRELPIGKGVAHAFHLPALRSFTNTILAGTGSPRHPHESGLVEWVICFGHALTEFSFDLSIITQSALRIILSNLPNVTKLTIEDGCTSEGQVGGAARITQEVVDALVPRFDEKGSIIHGCYLPSLEDLTVTSVVKSAFGPDAIVQFVHARRRAELAQTFPNLRRLTVKLPEDAEIGILKGLPGRVVEKAGGVVDISFGNDV